MVWILAALASAEPLPPQALEAVVLLEAGEAACAGAIIDPKGTVATSYHCVAAQMLVKLTSRAGVSWRGRVVRAHPGLDLALIEPVADPRRPAPELPWIATRPGPPAVGEEVWALGHPLGAAPPAGYLAGTLRWSASSGIVAAVGEETLQVTAPVNPGNSGGPVVDAFGRLVGVVSRRLRGDGLGFATRADRLTQLATEPPKVSAVGGTLGVGLVLGTLEGPDGLVAGGVQAELAFRDRVIVDGTGWGVPALRHAALRFGEVRAPVASTSLSLRQRWGRGVKSAYLQAGVGALLLGTTVGDRETWVTRTVTSGTPNLSGQLGFSSVSVRLDWALQTGDALGSLQLRIPGTFAVF